MNESNRAMAPSTDVRQEIMMFDAALRDSFASPPATYRPAPFLVLNDDHDDEAGAARVTQVLEGYRRIGYGGAFLHPRPGLITEYLSPEWFALIRHAVAECRQLGLTPYLYDENSYPSGVGGDHVPSRVPEALSWLPSPSITSVVGYIAVMPPVDSRGAGRPKRGWTRRLSPVDALRSAVPLHRGWPALPLDAAGPR